MFSWLGWSQDTLKFTNHKIERFDCRPERRQFFRREHWEKFGPTFLHARTKLPLVPEHGAGYLVVVGEVDPPVAVDEVVPGKVPDCEVVVGGFHLDLKIVNLKIFY